MFKDIKDEHYSYDDILLKPQPSPVRSRSDVVLDTSVTPNVKISSPLISAPMDSVTGVEMAQAMHYYGGVGVIHRFADIEDRVSMVEEVDGVVGASVGIDNDAIENALDLQEADADFICIDVAHGHLRKATEMVQYMDEHIDIDIMVGNVATKEAVGDLVSAGADSVKIGVGPGSHCTTREKTGHGVPQASAVNDCSEDIWGFDEDYTIIADGGIQTPGDAVKALMLGADAVMMGGIFGRTCESPGDGSVWGMASKNGNDENYVEGITTESEERYTVKEVFYEFEDGIRSGLSYSGGHSIEEARKKSEIITVTPSVQERNGGYEI